MRYLISKTPISMPLNLPDHESFFTKPREIQSAHFQGPFLQSIGTKSFKTVYFGRLSLTSECFLFLSCNIASVHILNFASTKSVLSSKFNIKSFLKSPKMMRYFNICTLIQWKVENLSHFRTIFVRSGVRRRGSEERSEHIISMISLSFARLK